MKEPFTQNEILLNILILKSPWCQDVDEFVSSWEQIWRNVALHYTVVNGCRQNESPNSW